jgi:hypothetical protein
MQTEHNSKSELHKFLESLTSIWSVNYWLLWFFNYFLAVPVTVVFEGSDSKLYPKKYQLGNIINDDGVLFISLLPIEIVLNGDNILVKNSCSKKEISGLVEICFLNRVYSIHRLAK